MSYAKPSHSRRQFLQASSFLAASAALPAWFVEETRARADEAKPTTSPNDRPHVALVGCGGRGLALAGEGKPFVDVVAVCDVDERHVADAAERFPQAARYRDFRKAVAHKGVDAVFVATPDHWHTLVNIHAMRQGKDVYSEKPLTLTVDEGRRLVDVARQTGRVLQTGTQQRSDPRFRLACELVRNGRIGKLQKVLVWIPAGLREGPFPPEPVPPDLDWDFWQGQAPAHEYTRRRVHNKFRHWYDYSGGLVTDWGAHHNDIALWGLGMDHSGPVAVEATRLSEPIPGGYTAVADFRIVYTYANGVEHVCASEHYDDGSGRPVSDPPEGESHHGVRFVGSDGWIFVTRGRINASDPDLLKQELPAGAERLYASNSHMGNFVECLKTRNPTICPPEVGHRSASICHLATTSLRLNRKLKWDPDRQAFPDDAEAQAMVAREMRKPWSYDAV